MIFTYECTYEIIEKGISHQIPISIAFYLKSSKMKLVRVFLA